MSPRRRSHWSFVVSLLSIVVLTLACLAGGCMDKPRSDASEAVALESGSFSRGWKANLRLRGAALTELHIGGDDYLFAYTRSHESYVLSRKSGAILHSSDVKASGDVLRPPLVMSNQIIYPTSTTLEAFDRQGRHVRSLPLNYPTNGAAEARGNLVFVGMNYPGAGRLACLDVSHIYSPEQWTLLTGGLSAKPAVLEKIVYAAGEDGRVYAVTTLRNPVWPLEGGVFRTGRVTADVRADDSGIYIASEDSKLYCLEPATGKIKWQFYAGAPLRDAPHLTEDAIIQYVPGRGVCVIDKSKGGFNREPRWIVQGARQFLSIDEQNIYLRLQDNHLIAADRATGQERFRSKGADYTIFLSNERDSTIFAARGDGAIAAIVPVLRAGGVGELAIAK